LVVIFASIGPDIGYAVGVAGVLFAAFRELRERRDRTRLRSVVIVHEARPRHFRDRGGFQVSVFLTNESASSAFNVRFGIQIGDAEVAWRHDPADAEASRVNVLRAGERYPDGQAVINVVIPDAVVFSCDGDPDAGRWYWARYESPGGEWWYTSNPSARDEDLVVRRVRSRWWEGRRRSRDLDRQSAVGERRIADVSAETRERLMPAASGPEAAEAPEDQDPPAGESAP
jgi:hypothetical protein